MIELIIIGVLTVEVIVLVLWVLRLKSDNRELEHAIYRMGELYRQACRKNSENTDEEEFRWDVELLNNRIW